MKNEFEIYINSNSLTTENWQKFYKVVNSYSGIVGKFRLVVDLRDKVVRFYIQSDKDLSVISNDLESMIIRDVPVGTIRIPEATSKERFVNFVTGGNLLDTKEKLAVKMGKDLEVVVFDVRAISATNAYVKVAMYFKAGAGSYSIASKILTNFPAHLFAIDFGSDSTYLKKKIDKYLDIEKSLHLFNSDDYQALFKIEGFPYLKGDYYLNLNKYDFYKHSLIVGASGSGKSKLISLLVDRIANSHFKDQYNVVLIDPHNSLKEEFTHIADSNVIGFSNDSVELFNDSPKDIQAEVELTTVLFKSLMADQFNPRLERVLKYTLFVLYTAQSMNLDQLKRFLIESDLRTQILEHVNGYAPDNVIRFFGGDFNEIRSQYYSEAILPIISLVDEMALQPGMMSSSGKSSMSGMINEKFLTIFSLNKVSMGDKVVKTIAGLIIQQLFLLAQAGSFGSKKTMLIIDEVSVVQNPALAQILSEARKFGLTVVLTQQYFGQIDKSLQEAIFANVYNYYVFKVSEEDAHTLEGNLSIELPQAVLEEESKAGLKESDVRVKILTELSPRECLVRVSENDKLHPCIKAKTVDVEIKEAFTVKENDLVTFDVADLPSKFVESHTTNYATLPVDEPSEVASVSNVEQAAPVVENQTSPDVTQSDTGIPNIDPTAVFAGLEPTEIAPPDPVPEPEEEFINISYILAEQSSSRKLVNEYKKGEQ